MNTEEKLAKLEQIVAAQEVRLHALSRVVGCLVVKHHNISELAANMEKIGECTTAIHLNDPVVSDAVHEEALQFLQEFVLLARDQIDRQAKFGQQHG